MYKIQPSKKFKRQLKKAVAKGKEIDKLNKVVEALKNDEDLDKQLRDHKLIGSKNGLRECHIEPDWLLIYKIEKEKLLLLLVETGTHSDLF